MRIAVYTMAKNEAVHVDRFVETVAGADYVVVTDTGSTDGTQELLKAKGVDVCHAHISPWRFDVATNTALAHVPADIDVCIKLDLDEVLFVANGGHWRDEIERNWQFGKHQQFMYWYTWKWAVPGKIPAVRFRTGNIHSRNGFVWRHPGHAALCSYGQSPCQVQCNNVEIHHYMVSKTRPDYLSLLELAVKECECPRTLFYLAREYFFRRADLKSATTFQKYLDHPKATWSAERAEAMRMLGVIYGRTRAPNQAISWLMRANAEYPGTREIWYELARYFMEQEEFEAAKWAGKRAISITDRDSQFTTNDGSAWSLDPFLITARAAMETAELIVAESLLAYVLDTEPNNTQGLSLQRQLAERLNT